MIRWLLLALCPFSLMATDLMPWFGRPMEIEAKANLLLQQYPRIQTSEKCAKYSSFDQFLSFGALLPLDSISAETELTFANTRHRSFGFDNLRLTGRYLLLDDVVGDCLSLTLGGTAIFAARQAVRDISSFHHGTLGFEAHMAFGRETPCYNFWKYRWWGVVAYGVANQGRPWFRGDLNWERNWRGFHKVRLFANTLWGLGHDALNPCDFDGYGPIHHQSIDAGFRYTYLFCPCDTFLSFEYSRRLYARNFPQNTNLFFVKVSIPFGL